MVICNLVRFIAFFNKYPTVICHIYKLNKLSNFFSYHRLCIYLIIVIKNISQGQFAIYLM